MKYLAIATLLTVISLFFTDLQSMEYALASFKYVSDWGSFIFGEKPYLEYEIDSYLKTVALPHDTTKEELENIVTKQAEDHFKTKFVSNYLYFAYLILKSNDQDFEAKLSKQVDIFVANNAKNLRAATDSEKLKFTRKDSDITF